MPSVRPKELLKLLKKNGFIVERQSGSHVILTKQAEQLLRVTIPIHDKDLKIKTLQSILKQANLPKDAWKKKQ